MGKKGSNPNPPEGRARPCPPPPPPPRLVREGDEPCQGPGFCKRVWDSLFPPFGGFDHSGISDETLRKVRAGEPLSPADSKPEPWPPPANRMLPRGSVMELEAGGSIVSMKTGSVTRPYMTPERKAYMFMIDQAIKYGWMAYEIFELMGVWEEWEGSSTQSSELTIIRVARAYAQENNIMPDVSTSFEVEFRRTLKAVGCALDERELVREKEETDAG